MKTRNVSLIVIEYIEGQTLYNFIIKEKGKYDNNIKMKIILEIMCAFEYLHLNDYIYRDLKFNNIIVDSKSNAILIDFGRLKRNDGEIMIADIGSRYFAALEQLKSNSYSFQSSIYFIITENTDFDSSKYPLEYLKFYNIYKYCFENSEELRPKISKMLNDFFISIDNKNIIQPYLKEIINIRRGFLEFLINSKNEKGEIYELYAFIGLCYVEGEFIPKDIDKTFYYLNVSAAKNNSDANMYLGMIFLESEHVSCDVNEAIKYLTISSDLHNPLAQFHLGFNYISNDSFPKDIRKAINFLTLSSDQNNSDAKYLLGEIYYDGEFIPRDVNKAINLLTLSSDQNNSYSQYLLGKIYYEGEYVSRDVNKAISLLMLSSDQEYPRAQYLLGKIYYEGQYVSRDIKEAIHYLTLSANQDNQNGQFLLGKIYYEGKYVPRNTNKAIKYLELSANQNNSVAQCLLALIYYNAILKPKNINKAM